MHTEIDTIDGLRHHLAAHGGLRRAVVQGLDLRAWTRELTAAPLAGSVFLGCRLEPAALEHAAASGALIFPRLPDLPYRPYRPALYTVDELMAGYERGRPESYAESRDQKIYAHFARTRGGSPPPVLEALAQRLHDHAIDDAVHDLLTGGRPAEVVAVMGGHSMKRGTPAYRQVARIAQRLVERDPDVLPATGGGPGAMEACHLGAWLAGAGDATLDVALEVLAEAPEYHHPRWLDTAFEVRERFSDPAPSLGVPTWFYGHEPSNLFATRIAKYFSNSLREDGLLAIAQHGVVYAPGSAGTVQEIFQDACQNHYGTFGTVSPMVLFGRRYWSEQKPVFPLLKSLAAGRQYADRILITDDLDEVVDFILSHPPIAYQP